MIQKVSQF